MDLAAYRRLRVEARRYVRRAQDVDDLVHDSLLAALEAGRDDAAWLSGVMRNQAAMRARSAIRRRRRESAVGAEEAIRAIDDKDPQSSGSVNDACADRSMSAPRVALLERLPPAARRVAVLALHGLNADEIRWILGLSATAFRQRLTRIRKALGALPPEQRAEAMALAYLRDSTRSVDLQFGLVRRALKAALRGGDGIGTHDADGHLIVLRGRAHTSTADGN